ncbi:hypothetical protein Pint_01213 [Pistacia integerrima]|uniref:Uncharacterized protein n=1 Tax=Pistacia integerrima TaxID=434235 RepID=A0ACC0ZIV3_9ROSI|nr:hypothetical protein Pint_01213 [Pistacia integerrima]
MIISPKLLFIVGNLIVVILIRESKFFASDTSSASKVYYDEYINKCKSTGAHQNFSTLGVEKIKEKKQEKYCSEENVVVENNEREELEGKVDRQSAFPAEELNKRAEDFIARVNRRRRLEARLLNCG